MKIFQCFAKKERGELEIKNYLNKTNNIFEEVIIPISINKDVKNLDYDKLSIHICDKNFKIIHASDDKINNLKKEEYLWKNINDIYPGDFSDYLYTLHKDCQENDREFLINLVINHYLVFLSIRPMKFNETIMIGSVGLYIPYII
jgi:hypothetical protein